MFKKHSINSLQNNDTTNYRIKKDLKIIYTTLIVLLLVYPFLLNSSHKGNANLHGTLEITSAFIGMIAAFCFVIKFYYNGIRFFLFIGLAVFISASEDLVHGVLSLIAINHFMDIDYKNLIRIIPATYAAGRVLMGIVLISVPIISKKFEKSDKPKKEAIVTILMAISTTMIITWVMFLVKIPKVNEDFFSSKSADIAALVLLSIALYLFIKDYKEYGNNLHFWIILAITINTASQCLIYFSKTPFDAFFDLAHIYKFLGYIIPTLGFYLNQTEKINNLKNLNNILRLNNHKLDKALVAVNSGLWELDLENNQMFFNSYFYEMCSYTIGEFEMNIEEWKKRIHPEDLNFVVNSLYSYINREISEYSPTFRFLCGNGKYMWINANGTAIEFLNNGNIKKLICTHTDITDVRNNEFELVNQHKFIDTVIDSLPGIFYLCNKNGDFIRWNKNLETITEYNTLELTSMKADMLFNKHDNKIVKSKLSDTFEDGESFMEVRLRTKSGEDYYYHITSVRVILDHIECLAGMGTDITNQKKAEHQLEDRIKELSAFYYLSQILEEKDYTIENLYQRMTEYLPVCWQYPLTTCCIIEVDGKIYKSDNYKKTKWTQSSDLKMFGEVKGKIEIGYLVEHKMADEGPFHKEERMLLDAITERIGHLTENHIGKLKLEKAMNEANMANKAKSDFLANMSHEIRTPMNAVIGLSKLMLLDDNLTTKQKETMTKVNNSSILLLGIINDILDYSKIESNKLTLDKHEFKLDDILDNLKSIFSEAIDDKAIDFYYNVSPDIPRNLIGDALRISQVLNNLISNAIKFTKQGHIELVIELNTVSNDSCNLHFEVKDTGIGINKEQQDRLFQAFSQADTSTTRKYGGSGLGLVISSKIISLMGGEIELESIGGIGSKFSFDIPFGIYKSNFDTIINYENSFNGLTAMVVDDQEIIREISGKMLDELGITMIEAKSGKEAVNIYKKYMTENLNIDLILMDWKISGEIDGLQAIDRIKKINHHNFDKPLPIFIITAYKRDSLDEKIDGFNGFLSKPITISNLYSTISDAMDKSFEIDENKELIDLSNYKILLAEDNEINKEVAVRWLKRTNVKVDVAKDGKKALSMFKENIYDLILMDLHMPNMSGLEATRKIREKNKEIPIIALSAAAMDSDIDQSLKAGMNAHIKKPIDENELYKTISKYLNSSIKPVNEIINEEFMMLEGLEGFDLDLGLKNVCQDKQLLFNSLEKFKKQLIDEFNNLVPFLKDKQNKKSKDLVHSLKSVSATIGAVNLSEISKIIEEILLDGNSVPDELINKLDNELKKINTSLFSLKLPKQKKEDVEKIANSKELIDDVINSLKESEIIENDKINELYKIIKNSYGKKVAIKIKDYIENYDNDKALDMLLYKLEDIYE